MGTFERVGLGAIAAAAIVVAGYEAHDLGRPSEAPPAAPVVTEPVTNEAMQAPAPEPKPTLGGTKDVDYKSDDYDAIGFLHLSISCGGPWSATLEDFLNLRVRQERTVGMKGHYSIASDTDQGRPIVIIDEVNSRLDGRPIPGIPTDVDYEYWMGGGAPQFAGAAPSYRGSEDPVAFLQEHRDAICNAMLASGKIVLPKRRIYAPYASETTAPEDGSPSKENDNATP